MKISTSFELVWQLAAREAIAGDFEGIEPAHFFLALLKFSELPTGELDKIARGEDAEKKLSGESRELNELLTSRGITSTAIRRKLRAQLGKGNSPYSGGKMHRSDSSREMFEVAAKLAKEEGGKVVAVKNLLEAIMLSPSAAIAQVLGDTHPRDSHSTTTPVLREYGLDLTDMAVRGELSGISDRKAEAVALGRALQQTDRACVFLLNDNEDLTSSVMKTTARMVASASCPEGLKGKKIFDVSSIVPKDVAYLITSLISDIKKLIAEAAIVKDVILYGLPITNAPGSRGPDDFTELIKKLLQSSAVKCVFRVSPLEYRTLLQDDPNWRKLAEVIWIRDEGRSEIPSEI